MPGMRRSRAFAAPTVVLALAFLVSPATAQLAEDEYITGEAGALWRQWQGALQSLLSRDADAAEAAFGELLEAEVSPLRLALFAERTEKRTRDAGALLMLEQDVLSKSAAPNARRIWERLEVGREQKNEADDGWYFASIGRFGVAKANFEALIASQPDPVALLEFSDRLPRRAEILVQLSGHPEVGPAAVGMLKLLREGEQLIKADPVRIRQNIERLAGPPRAFENGLANLKQSGEYAIPFIIQALQDAEKKEWVQPLLRTLPQIGRAGLNPLVIALRMDDETTKEYLVRSLGQIGYGQSVPYLLALRDAKETSPRIRSAVDQSLSDLAQHGVQTQPGLSAGEAFYQLAKQYYENAHSVAADARLDAANVWYWRDGLLQNIVVPTAIFNEIMSMRCCEEALRLAPDMKPALALWLAANFRREAQLPEGAIDQTRPDNYPTAAYFAQSAGAEYCLRALARAVDDKDPAVALGAIVALRSTAGRAALTDGVEGRHPLAEALSFPDRLVRIQAALALGGALPTQPFHNSQNLMPVLSEALRLTGGARAALVADPDETSARAVAAALRADGYEVVIDANLLTGLQKVRNETAGVDVIVIGSNVTPDLAGALAQIRSEFRFVSTPVMIVPRPDAETAVRDLVRADHRLGEIRAEAAPEAIAGVIAQVSKAVGVQAVSAEMGTQLAAEAALVLRDLALTDNPVFRVADAESALLEALNAKQPELREIVASVLGYVATEKAQRAIANAAFNEAEAEPMRLAMFTALAEAAKRSGSLLPAEQIERLAKIVESDANMAIRTAASKALGALNLPASPASVIIRNLYRG